MKFISAFLLAIACLLISGCKPGLAYRMPTEGMLPTIGPNDLCIANPMSYSFGDVQRFDLVVFHPNEDERRRSRDENLLYIMRVVGMPNEKIEIRDNAIYINDRLLEEPFEKIISKTDRMKNFGPIVIPADEYFFAGDNRPNSADSRYWTKPTVHRSNVVSKIVSIEKNYYKN